MDMFGIFVKSIHLWLMNMGCYRWIMDINTYNYMVYDGWTNPSIIHLGTLFFIKNHSLTLNVQ